jgi:hypothetical protein
MKNITYMAISALIIQSSVQADIEHNLTFALTASYSDPALLERDENGTVVRGGDLVFFNEWETSRGSVETYNIEEGSKITVERFSNREILTELIVGGGHDTSISGWALKLITPSDYEDEEEDFAGVSMFAVKGDQVVEIDAALDGFAFAVQYGYSYTSSYNADTDKSTERENGSARILEGISVEMQIGDILLDFATVLTRSETLRFFGKGEDRFSAWVPSSLAFTSIVGSGEEASDDDDEPAVLQGNMRASGGKLLLP